MPLPLFWNKLIPFGRRSEILGVDYLRTLGYRVIATGYHTRNGEVDIIAWDGDILTFIEVKARRSGDPPEDAVTFRKQQRVIRAARAYITRHHLDDAPYRFDILAVTGIPDTKPSIRLLRDAFKDRC